MDGDGSREEGAAVSIGEIYEAFAHEYGYTREYIQGEWHSCAGGRSGKRLVGFTRPILKLYWAKLQKRKVQEFRVQAALQGIKIPDGDEAAKKRKVVEEGVKDPLRSFPNDVTYITAKDCDSKIRLSQKLKNRPQENQWDEYRKECCLGNYGIIARRCSINDVLWSRHLQIKEAGGELRFDQVKAMVEFDIVRRQLYPVDYKGTGNESPPTAHVATLKKSGEYTKILQKLDDISMRIRN